MYIVHCLFFKQIKYLADKDLKVIFFSYMSLTHTFVSIVEKKALISIFILKIHCFQLRIFLVLSHI